MIAHNWIVVICMLLLPHAVMAQQSYPMRPIRIVVPFAPGGGTDLLARLFGQRLTETYGQGVTIDNRAGAGGNIGAENVSKAPPDGYTLLLTSASIAVNVSLYPKLGYNLLRDFIPIAQLAPSPLILTVHPSVPARGVQELIKVSKTLKGGVNFEVVSTSVRTAMARPVTCLD